MKADGDNWIRMIFKGNKVWIQADADGNLIYKDGKIRLKYRLDQDYEYWVLKFLFDEENQRCKC